MQNCAIVCKSMQHRAVLCNRALSCNIGSANQLKLGPGRSSGMAEIESKSVPGGSWDAPWPKSVPNASRERLSTSQERLESPQRRPGTAKKAPRTVREHAKAPKIDAESRPEAKKSGIVHTSRSRSIVGPIFCQFESIFNLAAKPANP